jgi:Ni,Fe-hydrogenase maturation factor
MDRLPAAMTIIGVEISSEEPYHEGLTPAVAAAVPAACRRVREELAAWKEGGLQ